MYILCSHERGPSWPGLVSGTTHPIRRTARTGRLRAYGRLPTDELRVSLVNYCSATVEDHEEIITKLLLDGGLDDAGRAAFCSGTRKDCRGDAVEEAAKRQSIADILSGINDDPPAAPTKKRRRKKRKKAAAAEL